MKKFNNSSDLLKGLDHIRDALSNADIDVFVDKDALQNILIFFSSYTSTHKVEINKSLDNFNNDEGEYKSEKNSN